MFIMIHQKMVLQVNINILELVQELLDRRILFQDLHFWRFKFFQI